MLCFQSRAPIHAHFAGVARQVLYFQVLANVVSHLKIVLAVICWGKSTSMSESLPREGVPAAPWRWQSGDLHRSLCFPAQHGVKCGFKEKKSDTGERIFWVFLLSVCTENYQYNVFLMAVIAGVS